MSETKAKIGLQLHGSSCISYKGIRSLNVYWLNPMFYMNNMQSANVSSALTYNLGLTVGGNKMSW